MGTKGNIIAQVDGEWRMIYVGYDSYLDGLGWTLLDHYQDADKIAELVSLGDCSFVGANLLPENTQAYHRDRNEDWEGTQYAVYDTLDEAKFAASEGYVYAWDGERWEWEVADGEWAVLTKESKR